MATIYLSSTYEDLKDYRVTVFEALRKSGYQVIAMEDYVATDQRPVEKCLADVEKADIYVGLFAFRYGYVPPVSHNNPDGFSITELEFRHAEQLKKPCLTFLADQKAGISLEFVDAFTEKGEAGARIKQLREYSRENGRRASFLRLTSWRVLFKRRWQATWRTLTYLNQATFRQRLLGQPLLGISQSMTRPTLD